MSGKVERIYRAEKRRNSVAAVDRAVLVQGKGIVGDRYYSHSIESLESGNPVPVVKNISLIAREELDAFLARNNAEIDYGEFRRNIVTSGIDLNSLLGKEFMLGSVRCKATELCEPCKFLAATVHPAVLPELHEKAGIRATILSDGEIQAGSEIKLLASTVDAQGSSE